MGIKYKFNSFFRIDYVNNRMHPIEESTPWAWNIDFQEVLGLPIFIDQLSKRNPKKRANLSIYFCVKL